MAPREALFVKLLWPLVVSSNRIFYTAGILLQLVYHYYLIICLLFRFFASLTPFWRCFITNGDVVSTALKTLFDTILFHESSQLILPISAIIWVFFKCKCILFSLTVSIQNNQIWCLSASSQVVDLMVFALAFIEPLSTFSWFLKLFPTDIGDRRVLQV